MKYRILTTFPVVSNGGSTGLAPIHVRITNVEASENAISFFVGLNFIVLIF
jgi:hypothetical protein